MVPAPTFAFQQSSELLYHHTLVLQKLYCRIENVLLFIFSHFFTSISGMKIHSVFNYKLHRLKVKCVTSIIAFLIPCFVKNLYQRLLKYISVILIISAIFRIYRRISNYISDFQNIDLPTKLTTFEEAIPNEILE